jgi:isopentenyldiphosphate isomerase
MEEYFDIVDEKGRIVGRATRRECHGNPGLIHRAVHVLLFSSRGELFLQKRSPTKDIQPGKWDTSVGGHLNVGETYAQAALRELEEEMGVTGLKPRCLYAYPWRTRIESENVQTYTVTCDGPFYLHPEEITEGRFWSMKEIGCGIGRGIFTPNFEEEFGRYLDWKSRNPEER